MEMDLLIIDLNEIKLISDENSSNELKLKINSKYEKNSSKKLERIPNRI